MTRPPATRHVPCAVLIAACALAAGAAGSHAESLEAAACRAFAGQADCRTVAVVDADACIFKVLPAPPPELDPAIAGCLVDEIGTRQVDLMAARPAETAVSPGPDRGDGAGAATTVRLQGPGVVRVLAAWDDAGAPVWEARDAATFEHAGDPAATEAALAALAGGLCGAPARTAAAPEAGALVKAKAPVKARAPAAEPPVKAGAPAAGPAVAGGGAIPRAIGVTEAWRLSAAGRIVLVDVRRAAEWRQTGIAETAVPITMHQRPEAFVAGIRAASAAAGGAPVALICATGNRSAHLQRALKAHGFDAIVDVKGGMLGGNGAPGWIPAGLPVKAWEGGNTEP